MSHLLDTSPDRLLKRLEDYLAELDQPRYRARQVLDHVLQGRIDPRTMSNVPSALRDQLHSDLLSPPLELIDRQISTDGTRKYGFRLHDGALIESVWIPTEDRGTLCVSSQAGCPAGCTFCATAAGGFKRNLAPSEIVAQWIVARDDVADAELSQGVTQLVFMGMGEPLLNYESLAVALRLLTSETGFRFSSRRVTVSTVGFVDKMRKLLTDFPQVRLALSLHSAVEETRSQIVPVNRKYNVASLRNVLETIRPEARRVTLEYVVLTDINDTKAEAQALADFGTTTAGHINLLPFHPFPGAAYPPTTPARMARFRDAVLIAGYPGEVTIRKSRGLDIQGACGQLALHAKRSSSPAE